LIEDSDRAVLEIAAVARYKEDGESRTASLYTALLDA
jgi:hypothetical protein